MMLGSIEAGGTKFVCSVSDENLKILERIEIPTTSPEETFRHVLTFFGQYELKAMGVGSFGPIEIRKNHDKFGYITNTPKPGWTNVDFLGALSDLSIPIAWTTDVNAAAYGEAKHLGIDSCVYFTVGTGVGGGLVQDGIIYDGIRHPEMGHMMVRKHPHDTYEGFCVYHKDCLEGLTCGPTIFERTHIKGQFLEENHEVFDYLAYYMGQAAYNATLMFAPQQIIFGGGVLKQPGMIEKVQREYQNLMKHYIPVENTSAYITLPSLGDNAATFGCLILAKEKLLSSV